VEEMQATAIAAVMANEPAKHMARPEIEFCDRLSWISANPVG